MKKSLLLILLASASTAFAQKPIKVQGTIDDPSVTKLVIQVGSEEKFGTYNSEEEIEVKKGKFTYTTKLNQIVPAMLRRNSGDPSTMTIFLVPDEKLNLSIKGSEYFYGGSKIYQECNDADLAVTPKQQDWQNYYRHALDVLQNTPEAQQQEVAKPLQDTLTMKVKAYEEVLDKYLKDNINVEGAVLYLSESQDVEKLYESISDEMKNGRVGKYLKARINQIAEIRKQQEEKAAEEQAKLDAMSGAPAKDFTLNDIKGNPLSLSSLRGKYVILDFWGSWCGWCIKGIPDMKKYYEKYAGKFEILGVDCNDTEDKWKAAVEKYELPWLHVYNTKDSSVLSDYGITGFPTKIVIDPQGNIAKIIVGEDPAFYTYLDELFTK